MTQNITVIGKNKNWFHRHNISVPILMLLFASGVFGVYVQWAFLILFVLWYIYTNNGRLIFKKEKSQLILGAIIAIEIISCVISIFAEQKNVTFWEVSRDFIRNTMVGLICIIVVNIGMKYKFDSEVLYTTIYFFCAVFCGTKMLLLLPNYITTSGNLFYFSENLIDQWIVSIGMLMTFYKPPEVKKYYIGRIFDRIAALIFIILVVLSFSRTVFLLLLCFVFPYLLKHFSAIVKVLFAIIISAVVVGNIFPEVRDDFLEKVQRSFIEISTKQEIWDSTAIVRNWRGYEVYCAEDQFNGYNTYEKLFGKGYGEAVDAKGYAYLVTSEDSLPYLHNGYYTTLIKAGIIGVSLNILFWFVLYFEKKKGSNEYRRKLCLGVVLGMACSMVVIHGVIWGGSAFLPFLILEWNR